MDRAMKEKRHSQRRACGLVGIEPKVYRYRSTRPDDASIRKRLRQLAHERRAAFLHKRSRDHRPDSGYKGAG